MLIAAKQRVIGLNATKATVAVVNQANRVQVRLHRKSLMWFAPLSLMIQHHDRTGNHQEAQTLAPNLLVFAGGGRAVRRRFVRVRVMAIRKAASGKRQLPRLSVLAIM